MSLINYREVTVDGFEVFYREAGLPKRQAAAASRLSHL